jgi:general secretion pathway protein K
MPLTPRDRHERGVVLFVVIFFSLLLSASVATFVRRATLDYMVARNREDAARAEALARGGVRIAEALLLEDRLQEAAGLSEAIDTHQDPWKRVDGVVIEAPGGGTLALRIEDTGARLNLNALFEVDDTGVRRAHDLAEPLLELLLEKAVEDVPVPPGEKLYDVRELAANLLDFVDGDEERQRGGPEDAYYQSQDPPYRAHNEPLFSLDELRLVEGFDAKLVEALKPYVSVYPYAPGGCGSEAVGCGVNLNTAPHWVLALLYYDDGVDLRLAPEDLVRRILKIRDEDGTICAEGQRDDGCTPIREIVPNPAFPPVTFASEIFVVTSQARVGEVRREVEAVVDRSQAEGPRLLSWRVR